MECEGRDGGGRRDTVSTAEPMTAQKNQTKIAGDRTRDIQRRNAGMGMERPRGRGIGNTGRRECADAKDEDVTDDPHS